MKKWRILEIVTVSIVLSVLANLLLGRFLLATLSTWPVLNKLKLLSPQAPIVINTKEEVRVSDTGDVIQAINQSESKVSAVLITNGSQLSLSGLALNLTGDGLFLSTKSVVGAAKPENVNLKLDDGTLVKISKIVSDPATDLVVLVGQIGNLSVVNFGSSKGLSVGDKLIVLSGSWLNFSPVFTSLRLSVSQKNDFTGIYSAGFPARSFALQNQNQMLAGQALFDLNGEAVGLSDGKGAIISSDVIQDFVGKYLAGSGALKRPSFGFKYKNISQAEAQILNEPSGAKITAVDPGGPAQKAGLAAGDIITQIDGNSLTADNGLEEALGNYKPGDKVQLSVFRNKKTLKLTVILGGL